MSVAESLSPAGDSEPRSTVAGNKTAGSSLRLLRCATAGMIKIILGLGQELQCGGLSGQPAGRRSYSPDRGSTKRIRLRPRQLCSEQLAGFLLHGVSVVGSADAEPPLGVFRKFADGDAGHAVNAITDGTDGIDGIAMNPSPLRSPGKPFASSRIQIHGRAAAPYPASVSGEGSGRAAAVCAASSTDHSNPVN